MGLMSWYSGGSGEVLDIQIFEDFPHNAAPVRSRIVVQVQEYTADKIPVGWYVLDILNRGESPINDLNERRTAVVNAITPRKELQVDAWRAYFLPSKLSDTWYRFVNGLDNYQRTLLNSSRFDFPPGHDTVFSEWCAVAAVSFKGIIYRSPTHTNSFVQNA